MEDNTWTLLIAFVCYLGRWGQLELVALSLENSVKDV